MPQSYQREVHSAGAKPRGCWKGILLSSLLYRREFRSCEAWGGRERNLTRTLSSDSGRNRSGEICRTAAQEQLLRRKSAGNMVRWRGRWKARACCAVLLSRVSKGASSFALAFGEGSLRTQSSRLTRSSRFLCRKSRISRLWNKVPMISMQKQGRTRA